MTYVQDVREISATEIDMIAGGPGPLAFMAAVAAGTVAVAAAATAAKALVELGEKIHDAVCVH